METMYWKWEKQKFIKSFLEKLPLTQIKIETMGLSIMTLKRNTPKIVEIFKSFWNRNNGYE